MGAAPATVARVERLFFQFEYLKLSGILNSNVNIFQGLAKPAQSFFDHSGYGRIFLAANYFGSLNVPGSHMIFNIIHEIRVDP